MLSSNNLIFLFGSPRSGTTWVGKIFDSNPEVLYRHEPDIQLRENSIPFMCNDVEKHLDTARIYAGKLANCRGVKTVGVQPVFPKPYRPEALSVIRNFYMKVLRPGARGIASLSEWQIPDFIGNANPCIVIKSVSALGRAGLFSQALPDSCFILILRHPCGHVSSVLRGRKLNKMNPFPLGFEVADTAAIYGLTRAKLEAMPVIEQAAWRWVVLNHKAMRDLQDNPKAMTLVYEDLCAKPAQVSRELFSFTGLSWPQETEAFLSGSTANDESEDYFGVNRFPLVAANKWREELSREEISTIVNIVSDTPPGKLFTYD